MSHHYNLAHLLTGCFIAMLILWIIWCTWFAIHTYRKEHR